MTDCRIGMLSTVLIGNSSSFLRAGLMVTPRGYTRKYDTLTGELKAGEKAGRSLNMGLDGWKGCVRRYLSDNRTHALRDIARHFDAPMGEILSAIGEAGPEDTAGDFAASAVRPGAETAVLEAARGWKRIRVVVRSEAGAVSELLCNGIQFRRRGDWLNIENEHFHLHIDGARIERTWFVRHGETMCGVYFIDAGGETVCNLSLVRQDERFDGDAKQRFEYDWQALTESHALEAVGNE